MEEEIRQQESSVLKLWCLLRGTLYLHLVHLSFYVISQLGIPHCTASVNMDSALTHGEAGASISSR